MALSGTDLALALVKDASKFEAKLKELAKAEAGAKDAIEKSKQMNQEIFAQIDEARKELDKIKAEQKRILDQGTKPLEDANSALRDREQKLNAQEKRVEKLSETLKKEISEAKAQKDAIKEREIFFEGRVGLFKDAVKQVCENA